MSEADLKNILVQFKSGKGHKLRKLLDKSGKYILWRDSSEQAVCTPFTASLPIIALDVKVSLPGFPKKEASNMLHGLATAARTHLQNGGSVDFGNNVISVDGENGARSRSTIAPLTFPSAPSARAFKFYRFNEYRWGSASCARMCGQVE